MNEQAKGKWQEDSGYFFKGSSLDPEYLNLDYLNALEAKAALADECYMFWTQDEDFPQRWPVEDWIARYDAGGTR